MQKTRDPFLKYVEHESWNSLARMVLILNIDVGLNGKEGRRLKKELEMIRHVIYARLSACGNNGQHFPSSFFVDIVKAIRYVEAVFERHGVEKRDFLFFLKALLQKAKRERMLVEKPFERRMKFERLKYPSDDYDTLRSAHKAGANR